MLLRVRRLKELAEWIETMRLLPLRA